MTPSPSTSEAGTSPPPSNDPPSSKAPPVNPAPVTTLWCVRHGQTTWNAERRLQGQQPHPDLTELGVRQAHTCAKELADNLAPGDVTILSSDLTRAHHTATIITTHLQHHRNVQLATTTVLREQALGDLEGQLTSSLVAQDVPDGQHIADIAWGGGESIAQVYRRLAQGLPQLVAAVPTGRHIVLVSHGDTLQTLRAWAAGLGPRGVIWDSWQNGEIRPVDVARVLDR